MQFTSVKETILYIKDTDRTEAFYHGKLGLPIITKVEGHHIFFRAGTSVLLCFIASNSRKKKHLPAHYGEGKLHYAFECKFEEYEAWKQKFIDLGIPITHEQGWRDDKVKSFYFEDPDGNVGEVLQPGLWD